MSIHNLKKILRCFCEDLTATQTAKLTGINRNTVNRYYRLFREEVAAYQEKLNEPFKGEIELDESYFGATRKRGSRRGRGTDKTPVFGLLKRDGRVYTQVIRNAGKQEIRPIIKRIVERGSTVYTDCWMAYDGLVFNGYKHYRIKHSDDEFSNRRGVHINCIESFWAFAKRRLRKFNGIRPKDFYLYLKECEFRFNERGQLFATLSSILRLK